MSVVARYVLTFILTALAGMVVFLWGVRKEQELPQTLTQQVLSASRNVVLKNLKGQKEATMEDMEQWVDGLVAGPIWSSRRVKVTEPRKILEVLLPLMVERGDIGEEKRQGRTFYHLKKK
jgi:hypothetical protein